MTLTLKRDFKQNFHHSYCSQRCTSKLIEQTSTYVLQHAYLIYFNRQNRSRYTSNCFFT